MPRERRYPSDLTDRQWELIESLLPEPPSGPAGRPPKHSKREVVSKPAEQIGFAVLPRRWVVERTFSWLLRWRRLVRDYERLPATHEAFVKWAMVGLMLNRLAPPPGPKPWAAKKKCE